MKPRIKNKKIKKNIFLTQYIIYMMANLIRKTFLYNLSEKRKRPSSIRWREEGSIIIKMLSEKDHIRNKTLLSLIIFE